MRLFFITTNDKVFLPYFFDKVFVQNKYDIAGLAVAADPNFSEFLKNSYSFMGIWLFARELFSQIILRIRNIFFTVIAPSKKMTVQSICARYDVEYSTIGKVNTKSFRRFLKDKNIDVLISVACPQILKNKLLAVPNLAAINVHYGLLPYYRGQYPSFWVLANGEEFTGVSVHYMVAKVDAGDILVQIKDRILPEDTFYSLVARLKTTIGPIALLQAIDKLAGGDLKAMRNDIEYGSYFSFPTKADMARFKNKGRKWR